MQLIVLASNMWTAHRSSGLDVCCMRCRRMALDVMRMDTAGGEARFAVCVASYGYMGDLMVTSEALRCLGPARYGLAGGCLPNNHCLYFPNHVACAATMVCPPCKEVMCCRRLHAAAGPLV